MASACRCSGRLSDEQIDQVAEFVSNETRKATGGGSVAAGFKPDDTKVEDCDEADFHCFEQAFANISYNDGPKAALDRFDEDIKTPGPIERDCHRIVHAIGAGALSHYDGNVGQAFVAGRPSCTSGYYHGILERASSAPRASWGPPPVSSARALRSGRPNSSPTSASTVSVTA